MVQSTTLKSEGSDPAKDLGSEEDGSGSDEGKSNEDDKIPPTLPTATATNKTLQLPLRMQKPEYIIKRIPELFLEALRLCAAVLGRYSQLAVRTSLYCCWI